MNELKIFRSHKDQFFKDDPHSPLSEEQRNAFQGLDYYPEESNLKFIIRIEPFLQQDQVQIQTSRGEADTYLRYGRLNFEVEGQPAQLTVYLGRDGSAFVPFRDQTSGSETYGAGRYLEPESLDGSKYLVDFNLAYNPWCAYSALYSCPLPPEENHLSVPIRAGEKSFPD